MAIYRNEMTKTPRKRIGSNEYELGSFLKDRRVENGWTRTEAATKMGISAGQLQSIENHPPASLLALEKILDFYGYRLTPKRVHGSKDDSSELLSELQNIVKSEFSGGKTSSKKSQLMLAGRIIEIVRRLSIDAKGKEAKSDE